MSAMIPLVDFEKLDIYRPSLVRVLVDAEIASKMLKRNIENRRQRRIAIDYIKYQIKSGEWRNDHPHPIVFSDRGRLIDGQHRLVAISEMGISKQDALVCRVETGARDDVREYLDTGVPRSLDDRVSLVRDPMHNKIVAQLCGFSVILQGRRKASPDDAREFFQQHEEAALFVAKSLKKEKGTGRIQVGYAAMEYYEQDKNKASEFYPALFVVDSPVQQARVFRDWLLRSQTTLARSENSGSTRLDIYYRSVWCMKAHKAGKIISSIRKTSWKA